MFCVWITKTGEEKNICGIVATRSRKKVEKKHWCCQHNVGFDCVSWYLENKDISLHDTSKGNFDSFIAIFVLVVSCIE